MTSKISSGSVRGTSRQEYGETWDNYTSVNLKYLSNGYEKGCYWRSLLAIKLSTQLVVSARAPPIIDWMWLGYLSLSWCYNACLCLFGRQSVAILLQGVRHPYKFDVRSVLAVLASWKRLNRETTELSYNLSLLCSLGQSIKFQLRTQISLGKSEKSKERQETKDCEMKPAAIDTMTASKYKR